METISGRRVVAKLPMSVAGLATYVTSSEVATISYLFTVRIRDVHVHVHSKRSSPTSTPTLFHPDLHKRNIFVSKDNPTAITGFIDWQSTSVEPAFEYAYDVPDFASIPPSGAIRKRRNKSLPPSV
ncbi:hypothetical protein BDBG_17250 [Blastomyces gilchristii SLH14081]|uniref:Altered inheritance of mitochondria protein 9, mitochondrial n=1 Tax=Blastomyces gilchristii (strain SLH14081) TaxID=559298 RepID=A0A179UQU9_BLAGS|nr:uncharacterized protein BDBG_17250 [Blastomyces gilchristii SLH14081]OAT09589.1 hypothetical protein BDBG_17250 [Blastomyces gilchristii SLH14081]